MDGIQPYQQNGDVWTPGNQIIDFRDKVVPIINSRVVHFRSALDVGCGNTRYSQVLCETFSRVYGIDKYTYDKYPEFNSRFVPLFGQDFSKYKFGMKFDLVMFWGVLYLFNDISKAIEKANELLNNDGVLIVAEDKKRTNVFNLVGDLIGDLVDSIVLKDYIRVDFYRKA